MTKDYQLIILITHKGAQEIRRIVKANTVPNSRTVNKAAVLTVWNSTTHPRDWKAGSLDAKSPGNYRGVAEK